MGPSRLRPAPAGALAIGAALLGACATDDPSTLVAAQTIEPPNSSSLASAAAPTSAAVTLITGDHVRLEPGPDGHVRARLEPAPGRDGISVSIVRDRVGATEELHVIPADAGPLIDAGALDPALFNVTALARDGLGTHGGPPLIVQLRGQGGVASLTAGGVAWGAPLPSIHGRAVVDDGTGALWSSLASGAGARSLAPGSTAGIEKIWLDAVAHTFLDVSVPQVGAPRAWDAGVTGEGAVAALLDSGVDRTHPDLRDQVIEVQDFTATDPEARDDTGHGTHVASTIVGTGAASHGRYKGVAPGAHLLVGKVCISGKCATSDIIAGMEWAAPRARVINLSLGGKASDGTDPLSQAVNALSAAHGTLFVIAAGNEGTDFAVASPSTADAALSVGCATKGDALSDFSSRGPRINDGALKPEIVAPGEAIVAARASTASPEPGPGPSPDPYYVSKSGTSMAAPHVTGAAALLASAHPDWDGQRIKATLIAAAQPLEGAGVYAQGAGRLDAGRAVLQRAHVTGSLGFGLTTWPHEQAATVRTVTLYNDGDRDQVFDCGLDARDAQGRPAPAGLFSVDHTTVTIPAGGNRQVAVSYRPAARTVGLYGGWLRVTSGETRLVVPVSVYQEPESYRLTIEQRGRDGEPGRASFYVNTHAEHLLRLRAFDAQGRTSIRLPRGEYAYTGSVETDGDGSITVFADRGVVLDRDRTLVLDAGQASAAAVTLERSGVAVQESTIDVTFEEPDRTWGDSVLAPPPTTLYAMPTPHARLPFSFASAFLASAPTELRDAGAPRYLLAFPSANGIPTELSHAVRDRDLARVEVAMHAQGVPATYDGSDYGRAGASTFWFMSRRYLEAPSTSTMFVTPGVSWGTDAYAFASGTSEVWHALGTYRRGRQVEHWNAPPIGPGFESIEGDFSAMRHDDVLYTAVPLFSPGHPGHATINDHVEMTLSRDGIVLGTDATGQLQFPVPADRGRYTLAATATRGVPWSSLATRVDATWTFDSEHPADEDAFEPLPLLAVRASGYVDMMGWAPAGAPHLLTLRVERQPGVAASPVTELSLEVSYDDGATWRAVPLLRCGEQALALLRHPRAPGTVSLRSHAADGAGNIVTQTVFRSYATR